MVENRLSHFFRVQKNKRELRKLRPLIAAIREEETTLRTKRDLVYRTRELQSRLARGETVNAMIVPALATVAEAARRILKEEVYDVQIMGGLILHEGKIAEMAAGEGKTLTAVLPAYLNALNGQVHIATQNDYLTTRDFKTMGPIFDILGIPVNRVVSTMSIPDRGQSYRASVVYVTNHELVFDYLHDEMRYPSEQKVFPKHQFAIIDEIDSILIDEARTPLIVSELKKSPSRQLVIFADIIRGLKPYEDYIFDKKLETAFFTKNSFKKIDAALNERGLGTMQKADAIFYLDKALKAEVLFEKGRDYLVEDNRIYLVDEFTGRRMTDRRYMEGIHQAIEAKEALVVGPTDRVLASMTYQSFFLKYQKLAGITGTIFPENKEFEETYKVRSVSVPTNKKVIRDDLPTRYFRNDAEKFGELIREIRQFTQAGRPILVATTSVKDSERISKIFGKNNLEHQILNADTEKEEPHLVENAGHAGVVTVATNMAGRGTDIILDQAAKKAGGLYVYGTKTNQSTRIDNQLRGRAGRQGEMGTSEFLISAEDEVLNIFGGPKYREKFDKEVQKNNGGTSRKLNKILQTAQTAAEIRDRAVRRLYLELNETLEKQRQILYKRRDEIFNHPHLSTEVPSMIAGEVEYIIDVSVHKKHKSDWDIQGIITNLSVLLGDTRGIQFDGRVRDELVAQFSQIAETNYKNLTQNFPSQTESEIVRYVLLSAIDDKWSSHLEMAQLLQDHLPTLSLKNPDPLSTYRKRLTSHFEMTLVDIRSQAIRNLYYLIQSGEYQKIPAFVTPTIASVQAPRI
jgi:preprotein translocase subunit SecA